MDSGQTKQRRFTQAVAWNVAALAFSGLAGIGANTVILVCRDEATLGVYTQALAIFIMAGQVAAGGVQLSVLRSTASGLHGDFESLRSALPVVAIWAGVVTFAVIVARDAIAGVLASSDLAPAVLCVAIGIYVFAVNKMLLAALNGWGHMVAIAVIRALRFAVLFASVCILLVAGAPGYMLTLSLTVAELVVFLALAWHLGPRSLLGGFARRGEHRPRWAEHFWFGLRALPSGLAQEANTKVDIVMLGFFTSDATVGVYAFVAGLAEGFGQLLAVLRQVADPHLGQAIESRRAADIRAVVNKVRRSYCPRIVVLAAFGLLGFGLLTEYWPGGSWPGSNSVFAILILSVVLSCPARPFIGVPILAGYPAAYTLLISITVCANIVLNALLIPRLGLIGAALATGTSFLVGSWLVIPVNSWILRQHFEEHSTPQIGSLDE